MNEIHKQGINKLSRIDYPRHIHINGLIIAFSLIIIIIYPSLFLINNKIHTLHNNIPWKVTTQQSKQLIIINAISLMIF